MAEKYNIQVKVISQKGTCVAEHKVGDKWVISDKTPAGMCLAAYNALYPNIRLLMFGGQLPWQTDPDAVNNACPDGVNPVIFEIRRIRK